MMKERLDQYLHKKINIVLESWLGEEVFYFRSLESQQIIKLWGENYVENLQNTILDVVV